MDDGALSDRDVLAIGIALCDALAHAHGRGVVHRDVKPGNVMVPDEPHDGAGVAKLTDFGVARISGDDVLTRTGDVVGTLAYMAPEQAEGRDAGPEADLYALALVLYEALAGVNPVRARGAASTARRVGARLPPLGRLRRDLPLDLCAAIDRAVLPRPEQRGTVGDLRAALATALPDAAETEGTIEGGPLGVAGALAAWLAAAQRPGVAVVVLAAAVPTAALLRRGGALWSAPALAPVLGAASLAGAWPALAGQAARPWHRLALGALGGWWLVLAEALSGERLGLGAPHG